MNKFLLLENYWKSTDFQQQIFIEFAAHKGFDPLVPDNWKNIKKIDFIKQVRKRKLAKFYEIEKILKILFREEGVY